MPVVVTPPSSLKTSTITKATLPPIPQDSTTPANQAPTQAESASSSSLRRPGSPLVPRPRQHDCSSYQGQGFTSVDIVTSTVEGPPRRALRRPTCSPLVHMEEIMRGEQPRASS